MKLAARIFSLLILVGFATFYISCDDEKLKKSDTDIQIEKLNGNWDATTVTLDGSAPSLDHANFALTITGSPGNTTITYTATGRPAGPSPWPPSGTLEFGTNVKQNLTREDGVAINYSVTETTLVVDFTFSGTPYTAGRVENVTGSWHFEFTKV